jgi:hypothetical protein
MTGNFRLGIPRPSKWSLSAVSGAWIVADIAVVELSEHRYDFWHDRAVFHFLV